MTDLERLVAVTGGSLVLLAGSVAGAVGDLTLDLSPPAVDRWNYPFAGFTSVAGTESWMPTFSALGDDRFDDRDGQALFGFNTSSVLPAGYAPAQLRVVSAVLSATCRIDDGLEIPYDPTLDPVACFYPAADPQHVADTDAGVPMELFGVNFRDGLNPVTYPEDYAFSPKGPIGEGNRSVYPVMFDAQGQPVEVSRNVQQRFEPSPLALGTAPLTPGALIPSGTTFSFTIDPSPAGVEAYLRAGVLAGRINLIISSLHGAQQAGNGGAGVYPRWYTKEAVGAKPNSPIIPGAKSARLQLRLVVCLADVADAAGSPGADGQVTASDVVAFFTGFFAGNTSVADLVDSAGQLGKDGQVTASDVVAFFSSFFSGCR